MLTAVNYLLGNVKVEEVGNLISITGLRAKLLLMEVEKVFGKRISNNMFTTKTSLKLEFSKFFLFDFYEVLKDTLKYGEGRYFKKAFTESIIQKLEELPTLKKTKEPVKTKLNRKKVNLFTFDPLPHQTEFFDAYDSNTQRFDLKGYILSAAPGTGKTMMGLYISEMLESDVTIIFSPNNALGPVWKKTLEDNFHVKPSFYVYGQNTEIEGKEKYWVFSHENLKFAYETIKKYIKANKKINIVIDECHNFNDIRSDRTNLLIAICKLLDCKEVLFMSGTPFKALGAEIITFLRTCDPHFNSSTEERFKRVFGSNGHSAINILASRIGRYSFSVDKQTIVKNERHEIELKVKLPNGDEFTLVNLRKKMESFIKERVKYYLNAKPRLDQEYLDIIKFFEYSLKDKQELMRLADYKRKVALIRNARSLKDVNALILEVNTYERKVIIPALPSKYKERFRDVRAVYKYVELKIQGEALGRILGKERERCNIELVKGLNYSKAYCSTLGWNGEDFTVEDILTASKTKAIFFTDYVEVVNEGVKIFKELGLEPQAVYADTNKDLGSILKKVENNPKANPIVATFKSLSTAVPLIMLDTCVFLNEPFRDYIRNQAESRLDRLGQKNSLLFYSVLLDTGDEPNISTRSKEILNWSKEMVEMLMGKKLSDDPVIIEDSFYDNFLESAKAITEPAKKLFTW